jgi:hypothetical protein
MSLPRIVMWEPAEPGLRAAGMARLATDGDGYLIHGGVTAVDEGAGRFRPGEPWSMRFTVKVDAGWSTRAATIESIHIGGCGHLTLATEGDGRWTADGRRVAVLDGCLDFDLAATPLTNTLPIRRLGLQIGETRDVRAAWVAAPGLEVRAVEQRYTRIPPEGGLDAYRYQSLSSGFSTTITVDDEGLVVEYRGISRRVAIR